MATPATPEIWNHGIIRVGKDLYDYPVQPLTQQGQGLKCHVPLVLLLGVLVSDMCREVPAFRHEAEEDFSGSLDL